MHCKIYKLKKIKTAEGVINIYKQVCAEKTSTWILLVHCRYSTNAKHVTARL
jgi:glutamate synthase domain-containing protein 1